MQQQRRIYAGECRISGVVEKASTEPPNDDDMKCVNFLLRNLPKQGELMVSLKENSETVDVEIDLMEWADADYESGHQSAAGIASSIIFNFPHFYKNLSLACDYLRSAVSQDSKRAMHSTQLRCNIKMPCSDAFLGSNSNFGEKKIRKLVGRIAAVHREKQIVKSRTFSCSNQNCRLFLKAVTQTNWFFENFVCIFASVCGSCGIACMFEDVSSCEVAEHQSWIMVLEKEFCGKSKLCQVSVYEKTIENPHLFLGSQVEMVC
jgi:hypothetical protein